MPLFFLAVLPPPDVSEEIKTFQKEIENSFGAIHAQKAPPHITIIPPFEAESKQVERFIAVLAETKPSQHEALRIKLHNFQHFDRRTLFVDVMKNEHFEQYCKKIKLLFHEQKIIKQRIDKHFFVPHITLANKDINKRDFNSCKEVFNQKEYYREFAADALTLLQHKEKKWLVHKSIPISLPIDRQ